MLKAKERQRAEEEQRLQKEEEKRRRAEREMQVMGRAIEIQQRRRQAEERRWREQESVIQRAMEREREDWEKRNAQEEAKKEVRMKILQEQRDNPAQKLAMSLHGKRKEIYKYEAPWTVYAMNWSVRPDKRFRLALGSFVEEYNNKVQLVGLEEESSEFICRNTFDHPYPTTKIMWIPDTKGVYPDLLATSGDYLRIWRVSDTETRLECLLNNNKNSDFCAPLTSFDWNEVDPNLLGTSSIDTTCTIWGLETGQVLGRVNLVSGHVKTQLIAHDKEVYDIAFSRAGGGRDMFASVGADGSVRMFDLRHLEHSTIIYEDPQHHPLLRLCWNKQDPNYLATMAMDGMEVVILDVRVPCTPVARLNNHRACVNGIAWAPHSSCHICTAADDHQALIWDIQQMPRAIEDPILAYTAEGEINNVQWASTQPDWIAICYNNCLEILRV
ncbi:hypothetical protein GJAV_G00216590 [Gymnothorax javanicus]|nr:hypothetical protein GJAV_G00216590 [Gymnothorax javanicus]